MQLDRRTTPVPWSCRSTTGWRPEHPFPAAPEDCYAATVWAVEHAADLGADASRLAVMGDSAGGNLAAVVSLMARDRGGPPIALQVLLYPAVDFVNAYPSEDENEFAPILGKADLDVHGSCTARGARPRAVRLAAARPTTTDLPPALIQTAQHDPLRDQGAGLRGRRCGRPGCRCSSPTTSTRVHGYISIPGVVPAAGRRSPRWSRR